MQGRRLLEQYRSRLIAVERRARLTVDAYVGEVRLFLDWAADSGVDPAAAAASQLAAFLLYRSGQGVAPRSLPKTVSALRSFYRQLVEDGVRADDPAALLERPRPGRRLPEVLPRRKVDALLASVDTRTPRGLRDRALFELVYSAGLRVSEAVGLDLADLSFSEGLARVRGKGSKERLVPFGGEAKTWLRLYLDSSRPQLAGARPSSALFLSRTGRRLGRKGIWHNYARAARLSGVGSKLHTLRHSYATELLAGGADLRSVQELLGHADLGTTQIYTHVDAAALRAAHARYLPRLGDLADDRGPAGQADAAPVPYLTGGSR